MSYTRGHSSEPTSSIAHRRLPTRPMKSLTLATMSRTRSLPRLSTKATILTDSPKALASHHSIPHHSRWSPDTSYTDIAASEDSHLHRPMRSTGSQCASPVEEEEGYEYDTATSDDSSIDIVQARREVVKRAQPQRIQWQPSQISLDHMQMSYDYPSPTFECLNGDDATIEQTEDRKSFRLNRPYDNMDALLRAASWTDLPKIKPDLYDSRRDIPLHFYVEFDDLGRSFSIPTEKQEERRGRSPRQGEGGKHKLTKSASRDFRGASHRVKKPMDESTSQPVNGNKTSFFHHSSLRRHNSTGNYTRAKLSKLDLVANIDGAKKVSDRKAKKSRNASVEHECMTACPLAPPPPSEDISRPPLATCSNYIVELRNLDRRSCSDERVQQIKFQDTIKIQEGKIDLLKVNQKLVSLKGNEGIIRVQKKPLRKLAFRLNGMSTMPPTPPDSPYTSLKQVQNSGSCHFSLPNSPQSAGPPKPIIKHHLSLADKLFSGIKHLR